MSLQELAARAAVPALPGELSVLRGRPLLAVDLRDRPADTDDVASLVQPLARLPLVLAGVGATGSDDPATLEPFDVVVASPDELDPIRAAVERNPQASVTLVQLLRLSVQLPPLDALVAESFAYATLQGGAELAAWLATRGSRVRKPQAEPSVLVARHDDVLHVELNRPRLHNLYDAAMRDALADALTIALADPSIAKVSLRGRGKSFCAGGDLAEFGTVSDPTTAHLIRSSANPGPLLVALADRLEVHVHGAAVGAGCELAAFAARVVATPDATFRLPEGSMGLVPGAGGTVSVTRRIGRQRAAWLMLTGETIDATTAHAWGLVDEIAR
ncbi:MAG TPA: enoyl-CoA hydratase/isomerase family protein [Acidimicrobiales bacterium]